MKFQIKCQCGDTMTVEREGLEYWAQNFGKLRHYHAEGEIVVTVTMMLEKADLVTT